MTDERLAELRREVVKWPDPPSGWNARASRDLLREVDRLRALTSHTPEPAHE